MSGPAERYTILREVFAGRRRIKKDPVSLYLNDKKVAFLAEKSRCGRRHIQF